MTKDKIENELKGLYEHLHLDEDVYDYCSKIEKSLKERFEAIDQVAEYNQLKVIHAMQKNRVSERHFAGTTGYGYDDDGRDILEKVYADIFHTEEIYMHSNEDELDRKLRILLNRKISESWEDRDQKIFEEMLEAKLLPHQKFLMDEIERWTNG